MQVKKIVWMICGLLLLACGNHETIQEEPAQYPVLKVSKSNVTLEESFSATITGRQDVEIYPRVTGSISRLCVREGERVKRGQLLFVIDQAPYQAALRTATANVHAAEARLEQVRLEYESKQILRQKQIISEYDLAMAKSSLAMAEAALEQTRAVEENAQNDLSYTEVKSPTNGVVGTLPYRAGALVGPSITKPLTSVSDTEQMYVYFSMTEEQIRNFIRQYGSPEEAIRQIPAIGLQLNDGTISKVKVE